MQIGLGSLGFSGEQFWALTPRELEAALRGISGPEQARPLGRETFNELLARYPDEVTNG